MATATDMATGITGIVTRPVDEYRYEQHLRSLELKQAQVQNQSSDGKTSLSSRPSSDTLRPSTARSHSLAGRMAGASAKSIGMIGPAALKGMMVDIPLALTEGLKSVPQHYDGGVRDHGPVTGVKSGMVVAGKTLAWGLVDGVCDVLVQPYKGARKEGVLGAVKGFGKGAISLTTKSGAGMFGVFAYPSAGISQSIRTAIHSSTRKVIARELHQEGEWMIRGERGLQLDQDDLLHRFQQYLRRK